MHMGTWVPRVTTAWGPARARGVQTCVRVYLVYVGWAGGVDSSRKIGRRLCIAYKGSMGSLQWEAEVHAELAWGPWRKDVVLDAGWSRRGAGGRQRAEWLQRQASRDLCWFGVGRGRVSVQALTGHSELDIQKYRDTGPDMAPLPGAQKWSLEQGWCRGLL